VDPTNENTEAKARRGRFSAIPPVPLGQGRDLAVLSDVKEPYALPLWRVLSDVLLWSEAAPDQRTSLFRSDLPELGNAGAADGPLADAIATVRHTILGFRHDQDASETLARACGEISEWLEAHEQTEAALQFAEASARVTPYVSARCYTAGRLSRRRGEYQRALLWLRRAIRLARRAQQNGIDAKREVDFANAHRGYGFVLADMGEMVQAEPHFLKCVRAAQRVGHHSLAGSGYHDLLLVAVHLERWDEALRYAKLAVEYYKTGHPRFPLLAHDVAFFWTRQRYYSSARPIIERILPWVEHQRERILVLSTLVRCAAAVRDHLTYTRAAETVLRLAEADPEMAASSFYHLAEGARCFQDWESAKQLARRALDAASACRNGTILRWADALLAEIAGQVPGEYDTIPEAGSVVDATRELIMRKLRRQPPPVDPPPRPENYPTD